MSLLFKILKYESEIFEKYQESRKKLLTFIQNLNIDNLSKEKISIFINDLKQVTDPIVTCTENINYLLTNNLNSDQSIKNQNELKQVFNLYLLLEYLRLTGIESSEMSERLETELSELSDSELSVSELSELSVSELSESV